MADQRLDELFGGQDAPKPRTRPIVLVALSGVALEILGLACTVVPGVVLVLIGWSMIEHELDRVESGYLPLDLRPRLVNLRRGVLACVVWSVLMLGVQGFLLYVGFYMQLWSFVLQEVAVQAPAPATSQQGAPATPPPTSPAPPASPVPPPPAGPPP